MDRHTSKPSMPGSMMSISTTSAGSPWNCVRASSPVAASTTVQPSSSSASFTAARMRSSSSTARIRVPIAVQDARSRRCARAIQTGDFSGGDQL